MHDWTSAVVFGPCRQQQSEPHRLARLITTLRELLWLIISRFPLVLCCLSFGSAGSLLTSRIQELASKPERARHSFASALYGSIVIVGHLLLVGRIRLTK